MKCLRRRVRDRFVLLAVAVSLSSCGGGGSSTGGTGGPIVSPTPTPTGSAACALRARQDWALARVNEWYLFPETLSYVNPAAFSDLSDYVDALTAGARAQNKDRYFTYVTSIAGETAYYSSGSTAGYGMRLHVDSAAARVWVSEVFESSAALSGGMHRGMEIIAVGLTPSSLRTVSTILRSEGQYGLDQAMGAGDSSAARAFEVRDTSGTRTVTLRKASYTIEPVSPNDGVRIIEDGGRKIGYVNLRTFIYTAEPQLRSAFGTFKASGIDEVIVDLRYNGGGLLSVAQTFGSLLGGARHASDLFARVRYRPDKSAENEDYMFKGEANAIAPRRIAFITSESSASASELVVNAFRPYLRSDIAIIGSNTYGKPVGQIALDNSACDDRLRLIAFAVDNADGQGGYFNGLATVMEQSCRARDDLDYALGDPNEDSVARAIDFLDHRSCTPMTASAVARSASVSVAPVALPPDLHPLQAADPTEPQRDMPGLF